MKWIFDVFSRRASNTAVPQVKLPPTLRNRVFMYCRDLFANTQMGDYVHQFWSEIHEKLRYQHGKPVLSTEQSPSSPVEDALAFLSVCRTEHFLDFIEHIFRVDTFFRAAKSESEIVQDISRFLLLDDLPYALTEFVRSEAMERSYLGEHMVRRVVAYPQIIRKESQLVHTEAIEPALHLLSDPSFRSANRELLAALEDYRRSDHGDCLVKCASAFESVLKIICDQEGWPYNEKDTAATLLKTVIQRSGLDSFFEHPLLIVATIRNRLSTAHGAGTKDKAVPAHIARYAITATAAAILLVTDSSQ